jgi:hypothetical protein
MTIYDLYDIHGGLIDTGVTDVEGYEWLVADEAGEPVRAPVSATSARPDELLGMTAAWVWRHPVDGEPLAWAVANTIATAQALADHLNSLDQDEIDHMWSSGLVPDTTHLIDYHASDTLAGDRRAEARHLVTEAGLAVEWQPGLGWVPVRPGARR